MKEQPEIDIIKYFVNKDSEETWGITCTTAGYEGMKSRDHDVVLKMHPSKYRFKSEQGRILNEFQLVYITEGKGVFKSASLNSTNVNAGTMFMLFPGEWHSYYPDPKTGWKEYWIGFKGSIIDSRVSFGYFSKTSPICIVGISETIINLYKEVIYIANKDKIGSQQLISSIALHLLGFYYYKKLNCLENGNTRVVNMLNKARCFMRERLAEEISFEEMAKELGMGYSWFRRMFKKYEGLSPAQYLIQLKIARIKELLTTSDFSISEIAEQVGFESKSQISTFFKKYEGISPSTFSKTNRS
ncbi:MAG: AraC family transcriptional regulator [Bacteroidales bacterium]